MNRSMRIPMMTTMMTAAAMLFGCGDDKPGNGGLMGSNSKLPNEPRIDPAVVRIDDSVESVLDRYDFEAGGTKVSLPVDLAEISGLAVTSDGRLFGHNDEEGAIQEIPYHSIGVKKKFYIGRPAVQEDLEGIAIVDDIFYLTNSSGALFAFYEGEDGAISDFTHVPTWLNVSFDIEGLCYDPTTNSLLMLCKEFPGNGYDPETERAVYSYSIADKKVAPVPRFVIPTGELKTLLGLKNMLPSSIERDPTTGHFIILSGKNPAIIEMTEDGTIIRAIALAKTRHPQPEGVTIGKNGELIVGDEGGGLTLYVPKSPVAAGEANAAPNVDTNAGDKAKDTNEGK